ncbi:glyoxalase [Cohnella sp. CFH 77786]|uniref:VOC family protein n=1 Tax=Cohnella sp. CFH 77786 TaxID=2662265 RepID=UPI001C60A916|nr:VOC family protein [Cohnella sp. CFH 77786]MBW5447196.1 glyoxalase [Cohnella sp. CFH 77786]
MTTRMHPEMKLGVVKLKVSDLDRSIRFYEQVVGLKVLSRTPRTAEFTADGSTVLAAVEQIPDAVVVPRRAVSGLYHFALLLPTRKDLGKSLRNLVASGIPIGQADHLVSEALYIYDPDNNGIEIYWDRPRDRWKRDENGNVLMASEPIDWDGLLKEAEDEPWTALPAGTTIGHVHFHVADLDKSREFYCDILGLDMIVDASRQMGALFISAGGYHHHIGLNIWAGVGAPAAPENGTGLASFTVVMPTKDALAQTVGRLRAGGVEVADKEGQWYAKDPSGILMRIIASE